MRFRRRWRVDIEARLEALEEQRPSWKLPPRVDDPVDPVDVDALWRGHVADYAQYVDYDDAWGYL